MRDNIEKRARDIFLELETVDSGTLEAALDRLVGDDARLRAAVKRLIDAKAAADNAKFFTGDTASTDSSPITEKAGSKVGPYKILQQIGEGGFGSVFLAEQTKPIRRRVALKIIKLGMDTKQVIARFEAERQALALMDHPHIASVLDAGSTDTGRPYFVMEYVVGDPITEFADAHKLSVNERLELFTQACSAVQHAHTKGIIHRDIKPGNVLVSMTDGRPFARVIDFGIAKATASPLTDKTLFTEHRQLIGTLEYMSPEQAEGLPDIDTRTDVYALGVMLYELLTGATPIDGKRLRSAAWDEMRRIIKEEEPPAPSLCLSRNVESLAKVAAARQAEPVKLSSLIRGELDWIAIKALDKDRARRYESPNELAADIQRHLDGESVVAAPPSRGYRVRKFVRKNKSLVISSVAIALVFVAGFAGASFGLVRLKHANQETTEANRKLRDQQSIVYSSVEAAVNEVMTANLPVSLSPPIRGQPEYVFQPTWTAPMPGDPPRTDSIKSGFSPMKRHVGNGSQEVLEDELVLPAMADILTNTLRYATKTNQSLESKNKALQDQIEISNSALADAERAKGLARLEQARTLSSNEKFAAAIARLQTVRAPDLESQWNWIEWGCVRKMRMTAFNAPDASSPLDRMIQDSNTNFSAAFSADGQLVHVYGPRETNARNETLAPQTFRFRDRAQINAERSSNDHSSRPVVSAMSTLFPAPDGSVASAITLSKASRDRVTLTLQLKSGATKNRIIHGTIAPEQAWIDWDNQHIAIDSKVGHIAFYEFDDSGFSSGGFYKGLEANTRAIWYNHSHRIIRVVYQDWTFAEFNYSRRHNDIRVQRQWLESNVQVSESTEAPYAPITTRKLVYSRDGARLYVGSYSGWVTAFDTDSDELLWSKNFTQIPDDQEIVYPYRFGELSLSPDQQTLIVSTSTSDIFIISTATGEICHQYSSGPTRSSRGVYIDNSRIAICNEQGNLVIRDFESGSDAVIHSNQFEHIYEIDYLEELGLLCFVTHITGGIEPFPTTNPGKVYLYQLAASGSPGKLIWENDLASSGRSAQFSPDGSIVATSERGGLAILWNTSTGERIAALEVLGLVGTELHEHVVSGIDFHPTQPIVATATNDGTIRFWDIESGIQLSGLWPTEFSNSRYQSGRSKDLAFHPSGKVLSVGFEERILHIDLEYYADTIDNLREHLAPQDP